MRSPEAARRLSGASGIAPDRSLRFGLPVWPFRPPGAAMPGSRSSPRSRGRPMLKSGSRRRSVTSSCMRIARGGCRRGRRRLSRGSRFLSAAGAGSFNFPRRGDLVRFSRPAVGSCVLPFELQGISPSGLRVGSPAVVPRGGPSGGPGGASRRPLRWSRWCTSVACAAVGPGGLSGGACGGARWPVRRCPWRASVTPSSGVGGPPRVPPVVPEVRPGSAVKRHPELTPRRHRKLTPRRNGVCC